MGHSVDINMGYGIDIFPGLGIDVGPVNLSTLFTGRNSTVEFHINDSRFNDISHFNDIFPATKSA